MCYIVQPNTDFKVAIRILLDSASNQQLVTHQIADFMKLSGPRVHLAMCTTGNDIKTFAREREVSYYLEALDGSYRTDLIEGVTIPQISQVVRSIDIDVSKYEHLRNLSGYTESYPVKESSFISCMLAEPIYSWIKINDVIRGKNMFEPMAQQCLLGTSVMGLATSPKRMSRIKSVRTTKVISLENFDLQKFWELEHLGILAENSEDTLEEFRCQEMTEQTTFFNQKESRWYISLPWRKNVIDYDNTAKALAVMYRLHRKYSKSPDLMKLINEAYAMYTEMDFADIVMDIPLEEKNKVDRISSLHPNEPFHVLESHPVISSDSSSSHRCRIVLNAKSHPKGKGSINSFLHTGKNLLSDLVHVLIRFRLKAVAFSADVKKMFLNIRVSKADRKFLYFIHQIDKPNGKFVRVLRFKSLPFGLQPSPYLSNWTVKKHCELFSDRYPLASNIVSKNLYVDDLLACENGVKNAQKACIDIHNLMKLGNFNMHKWAASDSRALKDIPLDCRLDHTNPEEQEIKVLGLTWNYSCDYLKPSFSEFTDEIDETERVTKREILAAVSSIWDPAGMVAPFTFLGKLIMQKIWQITELTWDSQVEGSLLLDFQRWRKNLKFLREFKIQRCVVPAGHSVIALMVFGDASMDGYCANVYAVCAEEGGANSTLQSHLIFAKCRVSPLKLKLSIPRLELLASLLAARSSNYVKKAFEVSGKSEDIPKIYLFSDSEITLWRMTKPADTYKIWLGNRLEEIHELTDNTEGFHWVATDKNSSDIGSRGLTLSN